MAIQGTQVPKYTNTHYFCIFLIFQKKKIIDMKRKINKKNEKQPNKNIKKHTKYKIRLTQNKKAKQTSNT